MILTISINSSAFVLDGTEVTFPLAPLPGELPKAEGVALAVYFAMNISRELGNTCSSR